MYKEREKCMYKNIYNYTLIKKQTRNSERHLHNIPQTNPPAILYSLLHQIIIFFLPFFLYIYTQYKIFPLFFSPSPKKKY